ncbi:MAG: hypothetical protein HY566_01995 [Candidatus Kerfeldbacteria bacterium]|nr:hypothetical protein [Candidatus Kerfeldbacteria bacterium]
MEDPQNARQPWNWFAIVGAAQVFLVGILMVVTGVTENNTIAFFGFVLKITGALCCVIGTVNGMRKKQRGTWLGVLGLSLVVLSLIFAFVPLRW